MNFDNIMADFNTNCKEDIITKGLKQDVIQRIPFSSPYMNYLTHGGFPRGKIVEFFGSEGGGKTTTALDIIANAQGLFLKEYEEALKLYENEDGTQKKGLNKGQIKEYTALKEQGTKKVVYVDLEMRLDSDWAKKIGVDLNNNFYLIRPTSQSAEKILDLLIEMCATKEVGIIVIDSIPYLIPDGSINESLEKKSYGGVSKLLTAFLAKIAPYVNNSGCTLLLINQLRDSLSPYALYTTPGGRGLKHACSLRMMFKKGVYYDDQFEEIKKSSDKVYGNEVLVHLEKCTICKPDRLNGSYTIGYDNGVEWEVDLFNILLNEGLVVRSGAWYNFINVETGEPMEEYKSQGKTKALQTLRATQDLIDMYYDYVEENIIK